jgi:hypothetical protein
MKNKTNVQHIKHIMEYSKHGALMQAFVIDALIKYSAEVVKNEKLLKESMKDSFVTPEAWVGCAKELNEYLNKNY